MNRWKKLLLCSVSVIGAFFAGMAIIEACADEPDPYDYYTSFFNPNVQGKKDYGSFYFTDFSFLYDETEPASEANINAKEWAAFLGPDVKAADAEKALYHLDSVSAVRVTAHLTGEGTPLADSLSGNTFINALAQPNNQPALQYYQFARSVEPLANVKFNLWDPVPIDTAALDTAGKEALSHAQTAGNEFLKLRYLYQAQRLMHYGKNYEGANSVYDEHIAKLSSKSHIKGWALALKAGEERRLGDTVKAAYLFSKVFADYPERRVQAYMDYHFTGAKLDDVLKLAKNSQEKATLHAINGFANSEISTDALEEVYNSDPQSVMTGVLLVREVNKLEESYLTPALMNNSDEAYSAKNAMVKTAYSEGLKKAAIWPLVGGLLLILAGIAVFFMLRKKQQSATNGNAPVWAAAALVLVGVAGLGWYAFARSKKQHPIATQAMPQGSYFVSLPDSVKRQYDAHIEKLRGFCTKLVDDNQYPEPQIGTLANAYLYFMQNKPDDGMQEINKLDKQQLNEVMDSQKQIIKLLLTSQQLKKLDAVNEQSILPALQWLDKKTEANFKKKGEYYAYSPRDLNTYALTRRNFYERVLAPAYLRQGDTAKAAVALLKSQNSTQPAGSTSYYSAMGLPDFWHKFLHAAQVNQILNWKLHKPADSYTTFLTSTLQPVKTDDIYELLGTSYLREHRYEPAVQAFNQVKNKKLLATVIEDYTGRILYGNPFVVQINDYPKSFSGGKYDKLKFAKKMADLQSRLQANPKDAAACFEFATGLYSTSNYGNSWPMISYEWSSMDYGRKSIYDYDADYIQATLAKQYFLKAREASSDPEMKAKCTFMAAKCAQKQYQQPTYSDYPDYKVHDQKQKEYDEQIKSNKYFTELKAYKNTRFYAQAVQECSYLSDFMSSR